MQIARGQHWHKLDLTSYRSTYLYSTSLKTDQSIKLIAHNLVKCQHLLGTGTRARGAWPSGFELSILALKIEHRPRINARMDLFSGWLLLNDHFCSLYFENQHKSRTFYTIFHYFVAFFTLPWATPNSVNVPVFPYHREIVGLAWSVHVCCIVCVRDCAMVTRKSGADPGYVKRGVRVADLTRKKPKNNLK